MRAEHESESYEAHSLDVWLKENEVQEAQSKQKAAHFTPKSCSYVVAKVIFRTQNSWNSFLWIDVGDDDNLEGKPKIVAKNSPVLCRDSVVGIIDYVGKRSSLVRLITDSSLHPAVRVVRNYSDKELACAIDTLLDVLSREENLAREENLVQSDEEKKTLLFLLTTLQKNLKNTKPLQYLAKGILQGGAEPLWRAANSTLKGIGFNYDVKDAHGPARDLRCGQVLDPENEYPDLPNEPIPLLQMNDLLVTSGMDGIFPEGLKVARISAISPLQEGAYFYELQAVPTARELLDLRYVTVLAPQKTEILPSRVIQIMEQINE